MGTLRGVNNLLVFVVLSTPLGRNHLMLFLLCGPSGKKDPLLIKCVNIQHEFAEWD